MAESLSIVSGTKTEQYQQLLPQIKALVGGESNRTANLANTAAALKTAFGFFWVGFYTVEENQLVLGPFQGPIACTRIAKGKGVCGTAWERNETLVVPDVDAFPGHIACSGDSRSEIVIPITKNGIVEAVLDVDSNQLNNFDQTDAQYLTELCQWLGTHCF
ncbi:MAG: diguanylate cyclase [Candidatus Fluviicola riflensis]|nr:MAG: diguanylate cyclase [Candidatus Fluviicola riflensis]OGS77709.1 MAG: diguanylate cyclase [Candidatus Fluviicola riflensis]OGS84292.1 MAG: diguanylate cyclase [Fluviicola sp. RIFCSPHIGHO2_12_FULL_43_24]OGS84775.1 MAG: diguanylate cyclase [Fluviicola sp. RIFCSPHIGHO2_01_FULL_43_53]